MMHLTIIAKSPVPGLVKTRLCPPCTPEQAAAVARAAFEDTVEAVSALSVSAGVRPVLLLDGEPQEWMPSRFEVVAQRGQGLAERLANGFAELGPGVVVGMETPHAVPHLEDAFPSLQRDVDVIGLAVDGGFWTIGLGPRSAADARTLIESIPMSVSNTGLAQLRRLHGHGRRVRLMRLARDLDTVDDLRAAAQLTSGRLPPMARAVLGL